MCNFSTDPERSQRVSVCVCVCLCLHNGSLVEPSVPPLGGNLQYKNTLFTGTSAIVPQGEKDQSFPLHINTHRESDCVGASVKAIIAFLCSECSRDLRGRAGAISSLCWINAVIIYQESLGITWLVLCKMVSSLALIFIYIYIYICKWWS